jgi:hypothetical protein
MQVKRSVFYITHKIGAVKDHFILKYFELCRLTTPKFLPAHKFRGF